MKLLAVDTSGPVCGVAVMDGPRVASEYTAQNKNTHSASLMPMVERCLESGGYTLGEMDALAVVVGPGSFTGVRIGVATVKGLAHGSGKPVIPVDALEALAASANRKNWPGVVCPLQDARAGQVYAAAFQEGQRLMADEALKLEDFLERVRQMKPEGPWFFLGDGMTVHWEKIQAILGPGAEFAEGPFAFLRPAAAGSLALEREPMDYRNLKEFYLRPPNAEKNKKLLEAMRSE
ncbi:MAG: tRNA (adenosine(37)-N6)-threonylcarbamoyltransferase complex dimerization subunit type 1 TsaB [Clostridia bacterium]|nr:tRNA (adenosine(37)-N6)-threonylcarbamoyltransferase complex dimerization subunit type 1 TsaB [Clostridia bacterium]